MGLPRIYQIRLKYVLLISPLLGTQAFAAYEGPTTWQSAEENEATYQIYCQEVEGDPAPKYSNPLVQRAAKALSQVDANHLYFYAGPLKAYRLGTSNNNVVKPSWVDAPDAGGMLGVTSHAHAFLTQLCGEFRDRATLVVDKLNWLDQMFTLRSGSMSAYNPYGSPWAQMTAEGYFTYLKISETLWEARQAAAATSKIYFGDLAIDMPITGQTVCETKFIFQHYLAQGQSWSSLASHDARLESFADSYCDQNDLGSYYTFRGDSNFKAHSPESNGMLWWSRSMARSCKERSIAIREGISDEDCRYYYQNPFRSRFNAARAGMGVYFHYNENDFATFMDPTKPVTIYPHREPTERPFYYSTSDAGPQEANFWSAFDTDQVWPSRDMGLNRLLLGPESSSNTEEHANNQFLIFQLLQGAVDRHTNWYATAYDDRVAFRAPKAYSPFVASSYEMSKSDGFTYPGATVSAGADGRRHWMFVFRVKAENWYHPGHIKDNRPLDFDVQWFDETSFGKDHLADDERAWDRLGSPLEGEYEAILYLKHISTNGEILE